MKLRSYQTKGLKKVRALWAKGHKRVVAVAPTGAGKGTMAAKLLADEAASGGKAVFVVHLRDVAEDMQRRLRALKVKTGMLLPGHASDKSAPVQIVTIQSLESKKLGAQDLVVVDEAHHYRAEEWEVLLDSLKAKRLVGFTATPQRADGKGLGEIFSALVDVVSYSELLKQKLIVPCRVFGPAERLEQGICRTPHEAYLEKAKGTSAFVFVASIAAGQETLKHLRRGGVKAEMVTAETPHDERTAAVDGLRDGTIKVIVNVGTMTEGVDVPRVSTIVLSQKLLFDGGYIQRVGRALRAHPGKKHALILDLCGAVYRHGMPGADREYSLESDEPIAVVGAEKLRAAPRGFADDADTLKDVELMELDAAYVAKHGGPRFIDWGAVDWSQSNKKIAKELGVSGSAVWKRRPKNKPSLRMLANNNAASMDWKAVDWSKPDKQLAKELGVSASTVLQRRPKNKPSPGAPYAIHAASIDWKAVDWSKPNRQLAKELGVSSATVWGRRPKNKPSLRMLANNNAASLDWKEVDWSKTNKQIAKELGVSHETIRIRRPKNKPSPGRHGER